MKLKKLQGKHSNAYNTTLKRFKFRFNEVMNIYEYKEKGDKTWQMYGDRVRNDILLWLAEESIDIPKEKFDIFVESSRCSPIFNPFKDYFKKLKKWDGKTDYIKKLSKTLKANDQKQLEICLRKFLVGTVDCLLNPDSVNDTCLVFQAPQGYGKSRWMRSILPKGFDDKYFWEGEIDTRNKDHTLYLSQFWFMHLDELESLKKQDVSALKSYITRQRISLRQAYGRYKSNYVRRASFIGSVNEQKFLTDTTGNRRWLVFNIFRINYQHNIDINKVWAQAYALHKKGFRHWFNLEEISALNANNENFREVGLEEELFLRYFVVGDKDDPGEWLSSSEILDKLVTAKPMLAHKLNQYKLGRVLSKYVKRKKRPSNVQKYYVEFMEEEVKPSGSGSKQSNVIDEDDDLPF